MKLIENEKPGDYVAFIATGDGRTELRVLRALSKIYDGSKRMYFPKSPLKRRTGISVLNILKDSTIKTDTYFFILDKEHVAGECLPEIERTINGMNLRDATLEPLLRKEKAELCSIKFKRGSTPIKAYIAISGKDKMIEENVAHLIYLEYGDQIEPEKDKINYYFKMNGIKNIESLIEKSYRKSGKRNIEKAFPHLTKVLKEFER